MTIILHLITYISLNGNNNERHQHTLRMILEKTLFFDRKPDFVHSLGSFQRRWLLVFCAVDKYICKLSLYLVPGFYIFNKLSIFFSVQLKMNEEKEKWLEGREELLHLVERSLGDLIFIMLTKAWMSHGLSAWGWTRIQKEAKHDALQEHENW